MTTCLTCRRPLSVPPSVQFILDTYPSVTPMYALNRHIPRCKHCDLVSANKRAMDAELPPPSYVNPVTEIEKDMQRAKELIEQGIRKEELKRALVRIKEKLGEAIRKRDEGIKEAWREYWGVWGPEESGIGALYE